MLDDDVVDQVLGGIGKYETRNPVDHHQDETEGQHCAARANELPDLGKNREKPFSRGALGAGWFAIRIHCMH